MAILGEELADGNIALGGGHRLRGGALAAQMRMLDNRFGRHIVFQHGRRRGSERGRDAIFGLAIAFDVASSGLRAARILALRRI